MGKPRILIFSTAYLPHVGGAEVAIKELTERLPECEFELITARLDARLPKIEEIGNVLVRRLGWGVPIIDKWWLAKWGGWKAYFLHREKHFDVAWSMMASWGGLAAWWFSVLSPRTPLVVTLQEGDEIAKRKFGLVALGWRLILSRARLVTVISNYLGDEARRHGYQGEIALIPNGVAPDFFNFEKKDHEGTVLITTSRLVEKNAVGDIISALKFLPPSVRLMIVGDGALRSDLENLVLRSDLGTRVKFLGHIDHADLPKYLAEADIFVRPSLSEGLGISFLEAMAGGLPVIATKVGGIPDFLHDYETGLFCKVNNPESIAEKVKELMSDQSLREGIARNARALVREKFTWEKVANQMHDVFTKV